MNLYEILEVSETASKDIIEKVYKIKVKKYHPDLQKPEDRDDAEEKMKQINEAYEILSDNQKRKQYDDMLAQERGKIEYNINKNYTYTNNMYQNPNVSQSEIFRQKNEEDMQEQIKTSANKLKIIIIVLIIVVTIDFISTAIYKYTNKDKIKEEHMTQEEKNEHEQYEKRMEELFRQYE